MATAELSTVIGLRAPEGVFVNEPFTDFSRGDIARSMRNALVKVEDQLGREYDLVIGGRRIRTSGKIESRDPADPAESVGVHQKAPAEHAEQAMQAALSAFETWQRVPVEERASLLF